LVEQPRTRKLLHEIAEKLDFEGVASPGDPFPGWEFAAALAEPREQSLLTLAPGAVVVFDEPEQIRSADERLWKRLLRRAEEDPVAEANYLHWADFEERARGRKQIALRELSLEVHAPHVPTRPSMMFAGNIPVAVAEARTMVEQGYRVAFFAPSNGELERL